MKSYTTYFVQSLPDITFGSTLSLSKSKRNKYNAGIEPAVKPIAMSSTDVNTPKPPDGGYGWIIVFAAFCNFNLIGGHWTGFSLLYAPIAEYFQASYSVVGWIGSVCQAMTFLPGMML